MDVYITVADLGLGETAISNVYGSFGAAMCEFHDPSYGAVTETIDSVGQYGEQDYEVTIRNNDGYECAHGWIVKRTVRQGV